MAFAVFALALVVMMIGLDLSARKEQVFTGYYKYDSNRRGEASFVTDEFEVKGHTSNVESDDQHRPQQSLDLPELCAD